MRARCGMRIVEHSVCAPRPVLQEWKQDASLPEGSCLDDDSMSPNPHTVKYNIRVVKPNPRVCGPRRISILTVAAELHGVEALIRHAVARGVAVSLGHQCADRAGLGCPPLRPLPSALRACRSLASILE